MGKRIDLFFAIVMICGAVTWLIYFGSSLVSYPAVELPPFWVFFAIWIGLLGVVGLWMSCGGKE